MIASAIIEQLHELGVSVHLNGQKVQMKPGSKVPPYLLAEVRTHKAEIIQELRPVQGDGSQSVLLARLQSGHNWLIDQHQRWQSGDATSVTDEEFSRVWNGWWELDEELRADLGFQGCIYGPEGNCPEGLPCQGCSSIPAPALAAQLALGE